MTALEDIERRQKLLAILFNVFIVVLILTIVVFAVWLITLLNQSEEEVTRSSPVSICMHSQCRSR